MANKKLESALHVTLLGAVLGFVIGELAIPLYLIREFTDWKLPWVFRGQWPPATRRFPIMWIDSHPSTNGERLAHDESKAYTFGLLKYLSADRVRDMANDLVETLAGWIIGNLAQKGLIFWLLLR